MCVCILLSIITVYNVCIVFYKNISLFVSELDNHDFEKLKALSNNNNNKTITTTIIIIESHIALKLVWDIFFNYSIFYC